MIFEFGIYSALKIEYYISGKKSDNKMLNNCVLLTIRFYLAFMCVKNIFSFKYQILLSKLYFNIHFIVSRISSICNIPT